MAIASLDDYIASSKQNVLLNKMVSRTTVATFWFTLFDVAGNVGNGVLAGTNTANGVVPVSNTAGYPAINTFSGGAGYMTKVEYGASVTGTLAIFDRLFVGGAYAFNANITLAGQPSYSARLPGTLYQGLEIWAEAVTASTGNQAYNVTYTNENGVTGHTTGATGIGAVTTIGRCWQLPLQSGDAGVQQITNVTGSVASAGTANIMVLRPLWKGRVRIANDGDIHDFLRTGLPQVYANSALYTMFAADATASGIIDTRIEISNN